MYSGDGSTLIGQGLSPFSVAVTSTSVQVHYNTDAACGVATSCLTTGIINQTVFSNLCTDPAIYLSNITDTTADISWNPGTNNDSFTAQVFVTGQNATNGDTPVHSYTGSSNSTIAIGLQPNTTYDFYLTGFCSSNGNSTTLLGPFSFTTLCSALPAPYLETFTGTSRPNCWQESGSEAWIFNTNGGYPVATAGDHTAGGGTNYAWINGSPPNGPSQVSTLISPTIGISTLGLPGLRFYVYSRNDNDGSYNEWSAVLTDW